MKADANQTTQGAVMIIGSGIAGMQAALDLADSGFYVHLIEKSPAIGGVMAKLDKTFPTNDWRFFDKMDIKSRVCQVKGRLHAGDSTADNHNRPLNALVCVCFHS